LQHTVVPRCETYSTKVHQGLELGMAIPDYQSLMLPVLLASADGEIRISDAVDQLAQKLSLKPEERAELLPSGKQTMFSNRVHWAKTYLGKAGLLESTRRGHFKITSRGREVISSNPGRIDINFLNQFEEFRQFKEKSAQSDAGRDNACSPQADRCIACPGASRPHSRCTA
jgi:restriction system protein